MRFALHTWLFLALAAMQTPSTQPPTTHLSDPIDCKVVIDNFTYSPREVTVSTGTRVTWTNRDDVPHTVTSTDKKFKSSGALDTDDSYSVVFDKPGKYAYFCAVHPHMTGTIVVR